jgi:hypothetical protein
MTLPMTAFNATKPNGEADKFRTGFVFQAPDLPTSMPTTPSTPFTGVPPVNLWQHAGDTTAEGETQADHRRRTTKKEHPSPTGLGRVATSAPGVYAENSCARAGPCTANSGSLLRLPTTRAHPVPFFSNSAD